ncbi:TonB-dependent receptor [Ancylomarina sp. 16SWW S1-10-2]|uniref:SusC/RagA family TonB-linked outer membrane protein n=1 Tax=Ancylomarina sp. 16SWW S1-10-2 TaxID=2499681 RepID=UPI00189C7A3B|nr:TonB-dependent receptor [Ancylomarina sp. 16SWW S1-10-2]
MIVLKKVLGRYLLLTLFALLCCSFGIKAQELTVQGTILSADDGLGIPGVSVVIKGTTTGTVSNMDGFYSLPANMGDVLHFSFIGMNEQLITITKEVIDVTMSADVIGLNEVIAIGYGTTTKRKSVGAISTMKADKLEATPFANVGNALQGQVVGLVVQNNGGGPGSAPSVSIRGGGEPLYVIDGVITSADDFNTLNSEDVESISFLKDASATAVYGSRAGNGIVLVTSKRGESGKLKINYSYNYQLSEPTVLPDMLNSYEFAKLQNAANAYDGTPATFSDEVLETIRTHSDLDNYPDNNWPSLTLKDFATEQRHNLSLAGGDKKTNYFVSLGYIDQGGILKSNTVNYERFNIRSNVTTNFDKIGLEVGVNLNASVKNYEEPSAGMFSIWRAINQNTIPLYRAYNEDGTLAGGGDGDHPIAISSADAGYKKNRDKFINAQLSAKWAVPNVKGLKIGVMANYRDGDGWGKTWEKNVPLYMQDGSVQAQPLPALTVSSYYSKKIYFETSANYSTTFGKHGLDATFVYNQAKTNYEKMSAYRRDYLSGAVDQLFAGPVDGKDNDGTETESANAGYVFRVKYDYDYKYIFEMSGRYDGNDNFAKGKKWGFFPATSVAWNISEESFMDNLDDKNIFNSLKLRASYGETGVVEGVNRFGYIPVYNLETSAYSVGGSLVNGYSEGNLVNPDELSWYTRKSFNYGLDFSSLNNKLSGSFEYFLYETTGYLQSPKDTYSQALGKDLPQIKSKSEQRRAGYEISLRYKNKVNQLSYEIGFNYSYYNQLWTRLDTEDEATLKNPYLRETNRTDYWAGGAVLLSDGLYQNSDEFLNSARLPGSTQTQGGDIRYKDENGDGKIDDQDKRIVGLPSKPHGNYGIDFKLNYKGWFMSGLFQGTGDRYIAFDNFMVVEAKRRTYDFQTDFWSPENPNALYPRVSHTESVNGGNNSNGSNQSDFYLKNAKYFRMKNLQIGYNLKDKVLANVSWISSCKMYVNGTNLFTISDVMDYFDPEQAEDTNTGTQTYGYPVQRTYSLGINVGF